MYLQTTNIPTHYTTFEGETAISEKEADLHTYSTFFAI